MACKIIVLATVLAACNAVPWNYRNVELVPVDVYRNARSPSISYGYGSGFSSSVGGVTHSTGIGTSFSTGGDRAYGSGLGVSDGNGYARGVGIASSGNNYPVQYQPTYQPAYQPTYQPTYQPAYPTAPRNTYVPSVPTATNFANYGNTVSSASTVGGSAISSAQSIGNGRFNSAVSSAQNAPGYRSAVSSANVYGTPAAVARNNNIGSSLATAQTVGDYGASVSAAETINGVSGSTAHTVQQRNGIIQNSGATSINGEGFQAAHSHAVNSRYY